MAVTNGATSVKGETFLCVVKPNDFFSSPSWWNVG